MGMAYLRIRIFTRCVSSCSLPLSFCIFHTPKAQMIAPGADFAFASCPDHIARAVLVGAEERAAAVDALFFGRLARIKAALRPLRIAHHASGPRELIVIIRPIPIVAPFPHVASD